MYRHSFSSKGVAPPPVETTNIQILRIFIPKQKWLFQGENNWGTSRVKPLLEEFLLGEQTSIYLPSEKIHRTVFQYSSMLFSQPLHTTDPGRQWISSSSQAEIPFTIPSLCLRETVSAKQGCLCTVICHQTDWELQSSL